MTKILRRDFDPVDNLGLLVSPDDSHAYALYESVNGWAVDLREWDDASQSATKRNLFDGLASLEVAVSFACGYEGHFFLADEHVEVR